MLKNKLKQLNLAQPIAIIGAGVTGKSCFDLLQLVNMDCQVFDENQTVSKYFADNADKVTLGAFSADNFIDYGTILLSPGVDTRRDCFADVQDKIITDIELFARLTEKKLIGVTGSNGKSTVVSLLSDVCQTAKRNYILCGNIGLPVLQALRENEDNPKTEGYIIELSSYHLERSPSLQLAIGVWLNVSPDHLDRYDSYADYVATKAKLLVQSEIIVANADDDNVKIYAEQYRQCIWFSRQNNQKYYYLQNEQIHYRSENVFAMEDFPQMGNHNADNVMAVFAVARMLGIDEKITAQACKNFKPLPARTAIIGEYDGVMYVNDSKGTNIGATVAAINGIDRPIILLAGGQGKDQNFNELAKACKNRVKQVIVFGQDAKVIAKAMENIVPCTTVDSLAAAVKFAATNSQSGDVVMLSPACASFDMFENYIVRGQAFEQLVKEFF